MYVVQIQSCKIKHSNWLNYNYAYMTEWGSKQKLFPMLRWPETGKDYGASWNKIMVLLPFLPSLAVLLQNGVAAN